MFWWKYHQGKCSHLCKVSFLQHPALFSSLNSNYASTGFVWGKGSWLVNKAQTIYICHLFYHFQKLKPFHTKKSQNSAFQSKKICAIVQCSKLLSSHNHQHLWCCLFKVDNIGEVDQAGWTLVCVGLPVQILRRDWVEQDYNSLTSFSGLVLSRYWAKCCQVTSPSTVSLLTSIPTTFATLL